jgi:alpha-1,6-mannosyltransferase
MPRSRVPPELALATGTPAATPRSPRTEAAATDGRPLRIADVALFYGERGGGIRTYLEAKAQYARRTGRFEHHLVIPGRPEACDDAHRHEQPSLQLAASNGYRLPLGSGGMQATLRTLAPDVVMLHDPYWSPRVASRVAHDVGAVVIAVHHSSPALHAAGIPGPQAVYQRALRRWYRRAYVEVDAVMSVVDPTLDARRGSELLLRLGLDPAFHPRPEEPRGDHTLYAGRLSREKGVRELLDALARSPGAWTLTLVGTGPAEVMLRDRTSTLGITHRVRFERYVSCRDALAREYARARCVVLPGAHETFGLAALEAAACGTPVVTARTTPSAALIAPLVDTFEPGDSADLARAIHRARRRAPDLDAGRELAHRHGWDAALTAELADLERLLGRR